ncbi:peptidase S41 family protein [Colletotrichum costaricense]|uniref:Peptidase S41 family protein n=1 Tax=Colletotrichum costaricense TaxID=1209916 RepID=A0AAI9YZI2_9PEZI|nr:peptidase S41 family protein [Colletotrichum costaricense]KAK1529359.1 peptidase S41 family protein [Colletotrichum costaricense]
MLFKVPLLLLSHCLSAVVARPSEAPKSLPRRQDEPVPPQSICGEIIEAVNDGYRIFYASDVYLCLTSVPFNDAVALRFIEYYNTTMQFQSTLAYLKNPPEGYQQPAFDLNQGLEYLKANVTSGVYKNQYQFEADLQLLVYSVHDAHVDLAAGILSAFSFSSPWSLVTASIDGKETPKVYFESQVRDYRDNGTKISAISHINDEPIVDFLTRYAALNSVGMLEPHADWNQIMGNPVQDIIGALNIFAGSGTFYPGDSLNFTYEDPNLNEVAVEETYWVAIYNNPDFTGPLTTGGDFYNYFVLGLLPASYSEVPLPPAFGGGEPLSGTLNPVPQQQRRSFYNESQGAFPPNPDVVQNNLDATGNGGVVTGYFYEDISTAVLSIPHFDQYGWDIGNFSLAVDTFLEGAQNRSLSKLVIDLTNNYGGTTGLALLLLRDLFPGIDPFAGSRRRSFDMANVLGTATTNYWEGLPTSNSTEFKTKVELVADEWVITSRLNAETNENFTSWQEYEGPRRYNDDEFSLVERYDLSNPYFHQAAFDGWLMTRYIDNKDVGQSPPFDPENIVILTDGACSSACALFLEIATTQGKARTIAVGGAPKPGPMQAAGGTRGARIYSGDFLDADFAFAREKDATAAARLPDVRESGMYVSYAAFNLRDQLRADDVSTPLQFRYSAADCRLYYTLDNVNNMTALWRDVARAAFEDNTMCVEGSTGYTARNGAVPKAPPKATPVPLSTLKAAIEFTVDYDPETPNGLPAGQGNIGKKVTPQACDANPNLRCPLGGIPWLNVQVSCGNNLQGNIPCACLPPCLLAENKCGDLNSQCISFTVPAPPTNKATYGVSKKSAASTFTGGTVTQGYCVPKVGTPSLGCPLQ